MCVDWDDGCGRRIALELIGFGSGTFTGLDERLEGGCNSGGGDAGPRGILERDG